MNPVGSPRVSINLAKEADLGFRSLLPVLPGIPGTWYLIPGIYQPNQELLLVLLKKYNLGS